MRPADMAASFSLPSDSTSGSHDRDRGQSWREPGQQPVAQFQSPLRQILPNPCPHRPCVPSRYSGRRDSAAACATLRSGRRQFARPAFLTSASAKVGQHARNSWSMFYCFQQLSRPMWGEFAPLQAAKKRNARREVSKGEETRDRRVTAARASCLRRIPAERFPSYLSHRG